MALTLGRLIALRNVEESKAATAYTKEAPTPLTQIVRCRDTPYLTEHLALIWPIVDTEGLVSYCHIKRFSSERQSSGVTDNVRTDMRISINGHALNTKPLPADPNLKHTSP